MDILRLFTALDLPANIVQSLDSFVRELKPTARLRWSPAENLHITTKFIGDWPAERLTELRSGMPADCSAPQISVEGVGFFPNQRFPKIFFARVQPNQELMQLANATDAALGQLGVPLEKHPYRPHVTLARIPESIQMLPLRDRLAEIDPSSFGTFFASEFALFESRAGRYTRLETFPLQAADR